MFVSQPPSFSMQRRRVLRGAGALGALSLLGEAGCARNAASPRAAIAAVPALAPVRASADRIFDVTVCLRPFRAAGPRLDTEQVGSKLVVHNYGHGGSGWSLSWGSSTIAVQKAMADSPRAVAVIGCGALGLTSAILARNAGADVTIYARELMPRTRSARATGTWSPDSRIALTRSVAPGFPALWEQMARISFKTYRHYLGLPGDPVVWNDRYILNDVPPEEARKHRPPDPLGFADYGDRLDDITPGIETLPPGSTPFTVPYVRRSSSMMFNIADYGHTLMSDFLLAGGRIRHMEFHSPVDLAALRETVVINCPGYGGRALWNDTSIVPVRGQIAWLIPQPEVNYGVYYGGVGVLPRRDGILLQATGAGDMEGYGDDNETPDRRAAEEAAAVVAGLFAREWDGAAA
jgi:glycine/D-amino acid oxidase-like deaminating enzyme